ncbi:uL15 family ribosomal protein [archaeon]|nr:uL15 family ribosomal protein [archaeon]
MRRFKKKISKHRGSRHVGRGKNKRGRGKGSRLTSKRVFSTNRQHYWKYEPERFKVKGFATPRKNKNEINLTDVQLKAGSAAELDLTSLGYYKVLGGGKLTKPILVKASAFSKSAIKKIEQAGGKVITA